MKEFKTSDGEAWELELTIGAVKRVKDLLGKDGVDADLLALDQGEPSLLTRLGMDIALFCDILFALVKPQADERKITSEAFGELLGGGAVSEAYDVFHEELMDFFRQLRRPHLATALKKQKDSIEKGMVGMEKVVQEVDLDLRVAKIVEEAKREINKLDQEPEETTGKTSIELPESSD